MCNQDILEVGGVVVTEVAHIQQDHVASHLLSKHLQLSIPDATHLIHRPKIIQLG